MNIPTIETDRLILRTFKEADLKPYARMCSDPEIMQYLGTGKTLTTEESWQNMAFLLGHWALRGFGFWAVEEKTTGSLVGRIGLFYPENWPGIEVGWTLVKSSWGKGYATEAAQASVEWGFSHTKAQELISLIIPENTASIRVSERIGQKFKGLSTVHGRAVKIYSIRKESLIDSNY